MKILIVDDHMIIRRGLVQILDEFDGQYHSEQAADGVEAMQKLRKDNFDAVLLDVRTVTLEPDALANLTLEWGSPTLRAGWMDDDRRRISLIPDAGLDARSARRPALLLPGDAFRRRPGGDRLFDRLFCDQVSPRLEGVPRACQGRRRAFAPQATASHGNGLAGGPLRRLHGHLLLGRQRLFCQQPAPRRDRKSVV